MRRAKVLGLVFAGLVVGCGKKAEEKAVPPNPQAAAHDRETYVHVSIQDIDSLDPAWAYDTASHAVTAHLYETLVAYKGASISELEPAVAEKVPSRENGLISADGRSYTFPIRKGVKFHKGGDLTAEDVAYSLKRFMLYDRAGGPSALLSSWWPASRHATTEPAARRVRQGRRGRQVKGTRSSCASTSPSPPS